MNFLFCSFPIINVLLKYQNIKYGEQKKNMRVYAKYKKRRFRLMMTKSMVIKMIMDLFCHIHSFSVSFVFGLVALLWILDRSQQTCCWRGVRFVARQQYIGFCKLVPRWTIWWYWILCADLLERTMEWR